jgi:hypothetical protein
MGTISKTVQHGMERFWQEQMRFEKLTELGCGDTANHFRERNMKNGTAKLNLPVVVTPQIDTTAATLSLTTFGNHMQTVDIVCGKSQMLAVTSGPGSSQMGLHSGKPQLHKILPVFSPDAEPNLTPIQDAKPFEPTSFYPCINHL